MPQPKLSKLEKAQGHMDKCSEELDQLEPKRKKRVRNHSGEIQFGPTRTFRGTIIKSKPQSRSRSQSNCSGNYIYVFRVNKLVNRCTVFIVFNVIKEYQS